MIDKNPGLVISLHSMLFANEDGYDFAPVCILIMKSPPSSLIIPAFTAARHIRDYSL